LAEYVASPDALDGLRLGVEMVEDDARSEEDLRRERAAGLYELLREKQLIYVWEKRFTTRVTQQIRDPWELLDDGQGTCLDIATTYATMCMASFVNVLLAVIPGSVHPGHAFVVLTPERGDERPTKLLDLSGFEASDEDGVLKGSVAALNEAATADLIVPVETTWVTDPDCDFEEARRFNLVDGQWTADDEILLIDAPMLQATRKVPPLPRPQARAIRRYVPSNGIGFREYTGDKGLIAELKDSPDSLVLFGPPGQGKSMIARHLAEEQPAGAAWLLDASEPQALINSLASAWLSETNEAGEGLEAPDREARAFAALGRLREAEDGWLVVLDNADGDPTKLRKLLPVSEPENGRRVLVTTTNPDWETMPGFEFQWKPLPNVAAADLAAIGPELAELIGGRRLMLEAFRALLGATGMTDANAAAKAPALADTPEEKELRGPVAFWEALRESEEFNEPWLRLCAFAAHLPPDHQPVSLLGELAGESADAAISPLEERGLIVGDEESSSIRMHRLFGAAIRRHLDAARPQLRDEVVYALGTYKGSRRVLDRYGDLATVSRLDARLAEIDAGTEEVDERLGFAQHGIAGLLERFGQTRLSGEAYRRAQRHLDGHPTLIADCLQGRARPINQHHKREPGLLRQAVEWARSARRLLIETEGKDANAYRCLAMEGLLTRALSRFPEEGETRAEALHRAMAMLKEADDGRKDNPKISEDEKARSLFNLAGTWVDLAQEETDQAEAHLLKAKRIYGKVLKWRQRLYPVDIHPHIAACEAGLGYVGYFRATLIPASPAQRSAWLRDATDHTIAGLKQRETLDGSVDVDEAPKSAAFLAKVALARLSSPVAADTEPRFTFDEALRELTPPRIVLASIPLLASDGSDTAEAIATWARSPALDELVQLSGGEVPAGLDLPELLAWLERFSEAWDFRGGKERNLFEARSLDLATDKMIKAAAGALGLVKGGAKPAGRYDHVLILGGLARACLARPLHAARLLEKGKIEAGSVTALGGYRELKGDEVGLVERVTVEQAGTEAVADEFDAMDAGIRLAFGLASPDRERGERSDLEYGSWRVHEYTTAAGLPVFVAAAPSGEPEKRRTNTGDSYEWFATEQARLEPGQRVLMVTSDIYVPFQHADALRVIGVPHGVVVETAGIQPGNVDPRLNQVFTADSYLQEVRSTIMSFGRLLAAVAE
jgi:hypothetical protein